MAYECPEKVYKYLDVAGLIATLEGRTLKFSRPSDFNDPFDIYLQEALGASDYEFAEGMKEAFYKFLISEDDGLSITRSHSKEISVDLMNLLRDRLRNASPERKEGFRRELLDTPISEIYDLEKIKKTNKEVLDFVTESFSRDGVFLFNYR